jgi:hypothetical protein
MKKHGAEALRLMMVVNYSNSEKMRGNQKRACEILDAEDWSAAAPKYKICVAAVRGDLDTTLSLMQSAKDAVGESGFRDWPVFEPLRTEPRFITAFEQLYGVRLFTDKQSSKIETPVSQADADEEVNRDKSENDLDQTRTVH